MGSDMVSARFPVLIRVMIAPGDANRGHAGGAGHGHIKAGVADHDGRFRRRAGVGDGLLDHRGMRLGRMAIGGLEGDEAARKARSEEHTSELQSLMRSSYAVFCLKQKKTSKIH